MKKLSYTGQVREGKLWMSEPKRAEMLADIQKLGDGRYIELELHVLPKRSLPQNNYYHAVVVDMVYDRFKELDQEVDRALTHEFLKLQFNPKHLHDENGEVIGTVGGSTAIMTVAEFMIYIEDIQRWASKTLGIYIPDPNEQTEMFKDDEPDQA